MIETDTNPYKKLDDKSFWRSAVANYHMFDINGLWDPKFNITADHRVSTFGSCFAQHIGRALRKRGYKWFCTEPVPYGLSPENARQYNYNLFSCRTGNIYTTSLLRQWVEWATGQSIPPEEYWLKNDRVYDPFRPNIEPDGFESVEEMRLSRLQTISSFLAVIEKANLFVFTLGLTESWFNKEYGYEYPACPGTIAGKFDDSRHEFRNQEFSAVLQQLNLSLNMMLKINPGLKILLTVSPVPLTATMSGNHVLVATMYSKSILRAVAGQVASKRGFADYFPSYEIINSPAFRGTFFEPNQRSINKVGVDFVMDSFFHCLNSKFGVMSTAHPKEVLMSIDNIEQTDEETVCEEELLAAFQNTAK